MPWNCPICGRDFKRTNQVHSCRYVPIEDHFAGKPDEIRALYNTVMDRVTRFGDFTLTASRSEIMCKKESTFLALRIRKNKIILLFFLDHPDTDPPVVAHNDLSRNRVIHQIDLKKTEDFSERVIFLLSQAYDLF